MKHDPIAAQPDLSVSVRTIDTIAGLDALRPAWDRLKARDLESTVFLSWDWLSQAFRANPLRWSVLVAHKAGDPDAVIGLLPLKYRTHWSRSRGEFQTELEAGGRLLWSEYTGLLCDPEHETAALEALGAGLTGLPWVRLSLRYVSHVRRARAFADVLGRHGCEVDFRDYLINKKQTNNLICPQVDLPESFATYMAEQVSANRRQKYRRLKRQHLESGDCRITHATAATFEADLDGLLALWIAKWEKDKGPEVAQRVASNYRETLTAAQRIGRLFLPVLWRGETRIGALGHIVDDQNGLVSFIVAGRSLDETEADPGPLLHFHAIRWAIEHGYICYDFGHGDEAYKFSYGAEPHEVAYLDIRRAEYDPDRVLDPICSGEALRRVREFVKAGKTDEAMQACDQLAKLFS